MPNKHYQKWFLQMPLGFLMIDAGILLIMYSANKRASDEWLIWGIVAAAIITSGLGCWATPTQSKIRSDKKAEITRTSICC